MLYIQMSMNRIFYKKSIVSFVFFILLLSGLPAVISTSTTNNPLSTLDGLTGHPSSTSKTSSIIEMINETLLRRYLEPLVSYGPRMTGTFGCEQSAAFIKNQFTEMGLFARYQNWTDFGNIYHPYHFTSQNVEGTLPGSDNSDNGIIIFNAHYDSVTQAPGANDDGSGTAAVLAAAEVLSHFSFNRTIKFVTFSGEEEGLLGSQAYAKEAYQQRQNIMLDVDADMIGHATTATGGHSMRLTVTEDAAWVMNICDNVSSQNNLGFTFNHGAVSREGRGGSDYFSFAQYGWETLATWEADHDPAMHTQNDDLNNINFSYLVNTTRIIAGTIAYLADTQNTYPQVQIESPRIGYLYSSGMEKRPLPDLKTLVVNRLWIWADVKYTTSPVVRAEFYVDDTLVFTDTEPPFKWEFNKFSVRTHRITVVVYDTLGRKTTTWQDIRFINLLLKH